MFQALCSQVLDAIPSAIIIIDKELKIIYYNKSLKNVFNPKANAISIGKSINCATLPKDCKCGQGKYCKTCLLNMLICEAVKNNVAVKGRYVDKKVCIDEKEKYYRFKLNVIPLDGEYFCCVMQDITEIYDKSVKIFNKRMNMDFERAKTIQSLLIPPFDKLKPLADFLYYYRQNYLVGGDLFDVYKYDENSFAGYMADISGSGISAGMLTVYLHENYPQNIKSPAKSLKRFAEKFKTLKLSEESYITAIAFSVDTINKKLYICNAGHGVPAILKRGNTVKLIFIRGNTVSNWYEGISFNDSVFDYKSGDFLILMTDGIPDLKNDEGKFFTFEKAKDIIERSEQCMSEILKKVVIGLVDFCKGIFPKDADDTALLIIELK